MMMQRHEFLFRDLDITQPIGKVLIFTEKQLLLFDLDGTLIDSAPDLAKAVNYTLATLGYPTYDLDTIHHWVGNGAQVLVKRALLGRRDIEGVSIDPALYATAFKTFMAYYRAHLCEETYAYEGVPSTLEALQKRGYTMAIVTNKPYDFVLPILQKLQLVDYFDDYIGGDSLENKKPDPAPLHYMCQKYDRTIAQTLMVGDSKNDILAANACGMESVGVTYGYNYGETITRYSPTVTINHFKTLLEYL